MTSFIDLPRGCIVSVSEYLPKTSRALFAVALSGPSKSVRLMGWNELSDASKSILIRHTHTFFSPLIIRMIKMTMNPHPTQRR